MKWRVFLFLLLILLGSGSDSEVKATTTTYTPEAGQVVWGVSSDGDPSDAAWTATVTNMGASDDSRNLETIGSSTTYTVMRWDLTIVSPSSNNISEIKITREGCNYINTGISAGATFKIWNYSSLSWDTIGNDNANCGSSTDTTYITSVSKNAYVDSSGNMSIGIMGTNPIPSGGNFGRISTDYWAVQVVYTVGAPPSSTTYTEYTPSDPNVVEGYNSTANLDSISTATTESQMASSDDSRESVSNNTNGNYMLIRWNLTIDKLPSTYTYTMLSMEHEGYGKASSSARGRTFKMWNYGTSGWDTVCTGENTNTADASFFCFVDWNKYMDVNGNMKIGVITWYPVSSSISVYLYTDLWKVTIWYGNSPSAPTNIAASSPTTSTMTISWDVVSGATSYKIWRNNACTSTALATGLTGTSYGDSGLSANTSYQWSMKATNAGGDSACSTASTAKYTLSSDPTIGTLTADSTSAITVNWSSGGAQSGYKVYYSGDNYATPLYTGALTSYQKTDLNANTTYTFRIYSYNGDSTNSASYATGSKYTLPNAPTGLGGTANSTSQITWSWTAPSGSGTLTYTVHDASHNVICSATSNLYCAQGTLSVNTQYTVHVYATNSGGNSSETSNASQYTLPNAPTGLGGTANSTSQITWSWSAPTGGASTYTLHDASNNIITGCNAVATTSCAQASLSANTNYGPYHLHAANSGGNGAASDTASKYTQSNVPESPLILTPYTSSINISWTGCSSNACTGYKIYRNGDLVQTITSPSTTSWGDTGLDPNTSYNFVIKSYNGDSIENSSGISNSTYTLSSTPTGASAVADSSTAITVSWSTGGSQAGYKLTYNVDNYSSSLYNGTNTSYQVTNLTPSTEYTFHIYSYNGDSPPVDSTNYATAIGTTSTGGPSTPTNVAASVLSSSSIRISWDDMSADSYKIYDSSNCGGTAIATDVTGLSYDHTDLSPNTQHQYTVKAHNTQGDSGCSDPTSAIYTKAKVPAITVNSNSSTSLSFIISENGNPSTVTYAIMVNTDYAQQNGTPTSSTTLDASAVYQTYANWNGATGVAITGLSVNTQYSFNIIARNTDNIDSDWSATDQKYTLAVIPTGAPTCTGGTGKITVVWTAVVGTNPSGTEFRVCRSNDTECSTWISSAIATTYDDAAVTMGTSYQYKVKARNGNQVETAFSDLSTATSPLSNPVPSEAPSGVGSSIQTPVTTSPPTNPPATSHPTTPPRSLRIAFNEFWNNLLGWGKKLLIPAIAVVLGLIVVGGFFLFKSSDETRQPVNEEGFFSLEVILAIIGISIFFVILFLVMVKIGLVGIHTQTFLNNVINSINNTIKSIMSVKLKDVYEAIKALLGSISPKLYGG